MQFRPRCEKQYLQCVQFSPHLLYTWVLNIVSTIDVCKIPYYIQRVGTAATVFIPPPDLSVGATNESAQLPQG